MSPTPNDELPSQPVSTTTMTGAQRGLMLGLISAVGYSAANLALRGLSGRHEDLAWAIWVSAMKALPTVVLAAVLLFRRLLKKQALYPSRRPVPALFMAALVMQFGGNLGFQIAIGQIGLAITVPLVFALIICGGAVLGRMFLGDGVSPRTLAAMGVMSISVMLLSWAATLHGGDESELAQNRLVWFGVLMAVVSGTSYGINGVVIRGIAKKSLPVESMLIIYSSTGLVCLSLLGWQLMGTERLMAIELREWQMMLFAGGFNALAFFCITHSLKLLNITQVNVINASQNAMCALGAVLIFSEPHSVPMVAGVVLSMVGLVILDRK